MFVQATTDPFDGTWHIVKAVHHFGWYTQFVTFCGYSFALGAFTLITLDESIEPVCGECRKESRA